MIHPTTKEIPVGNKNVMNVMFLFVLMMTSSQWTTSIISMLIGLEVSLKVKKQKTRRKRRIEKEKETSKKALKVKLIKITSDLKLKHFIAKLHAI